jgi:hypothetical protein
MDFFPNWDFYRGFSLYFNIINIAGRISDAAVGGPVGGPVLRFMSFKRGMRKAHGHLARLEPTNNMVISVQFSQFT